MQSLAIVVLVFGVAVNAAIIPSYSTSVVTSERSGDNFAYSVHDQQQAFLQPSGTVVAKQLAYARALPGQMSMYTPGSYVASGVPSMSGMGHLYGGAYPIVHPGVTTYAAQPLAQPIGYSGQPLLMGHQAGVGVGTVGIGQHHIAQPLKI